MFNSQLFTSSHNPTATLKQEYQLNGYPPVIFFVIDYVIYLLNGATQKSSGSILIGISKRVFIF